MSVHKLIIILVNYKMKKKYIFVLCPPYQGSTIITHLINNKNVSTFADITINYESQALYEKYGCVDYKQNKWNPEYNLDMNIVKKIFDEHLDENCNIYLEKSPPNICRAKIFEDYFSQFGDVIFVISIRNPYSTKYGAKKWITHAEQQKFNIENLKNVIVTSYEECCNNTYVLIDKITKGIPELGPIDDNAENKKARTSKYDVHDRATQIHNKKVDRIINKEEKNIVLREHVELMKYFGYDIIE